VEASDSQSDRKWDLSLNLVKEKSASLESRLITSGYLTHPSFPISRAYHNFSNSDFGSNEEMTAATALTTQSGLPLPFISLHATHRSRQERKGNLLPVCRGEMPCSRIKVVSAFEEGF